MKNTDKLSEWFKELNDINKKKIEIDKIMESQGIETLTKDK
jgi:hypothetical protein|tara:strand:- start:610 stop:732 length:123 start_codon:yes stop_codon:yes gene_type:complete